MLAHSYPWNRMSCRTEDSRSTIEQARSFFNKMQEKRTKGVRCQWALPISNLTPVSNPLQLILRTSSKAGITIRHHCKCKTGCVPSTRYQIRESIQVPKAKSEPETRCWAGVTTVVRFPNRVPCPGRCPLQALKPYLSSIT